MHILLTYVTVGRGGDAIQLLALADALRAQGHEVTLLGGNAVAPYAFTGAGGHAKTLIRRSPWWVRDLLEAGLSLVVAWRAIRAGRARPCALHVHRAGVYDGVVGCVARRLGIPLALYLDAHVESERGFRGEPYWRALHKTAMCSLGRAAAVVVVPSRPIAAYYVGLGLPATRMVVRRNGVHRRHVRMGEEAARTHPPFADPRRCTLGFAGSLTRWHRMGLLLEALRDLNAPAVSGAPGQSPPPISYRLVVVGRGAEYERLRARARALGVDAAVDWLGPKVHDDAVAAMRAFDIAVLPHTLSTGTPMKLTEYASMGRPIVAPDLPNIRDMFVPEQEICVFEPGDPGALAAAIRRLTAAPEDARRMATAARARVAESTWDDTAEFLVRHAAGSIARPEDGVAFTTARDRVKSESGR